MLGLPELAAGAAAGAAGLLEGIAGPFPDDLGGGDRGRFLKRKMETEGERLTVTFDSNDTRRGGQNMKLNLYNDRSISGFYR